MAKVISIINNKGGVGKTMTAQNLSAALALKGKKVCMIDLDSQHNLTNRYENGERESKSLASSDYRGKTISDYLLSDAEINPIPVKENLYLIPSTIELSEMAAQLYRLKGSDNPGDLLKNLCNDLSDVFDYIVVDTEPGMSALMVNSARAADLILIPVNCQDALFGAREGVFGILDSNSLNTPYYFLQTMFEKRLRGNRDIRSTLIESGNTFKTFINRNEYLNAAGNLGLDIFEFQPKSGGAAEYKDLATEIVSICKRLK